MRVNYFAAARLAATVSYWLGVRSIALSRQTWRRSNLMRHIRSLSNEVTSAPNWTFPEPCVGSSHIQVLAYGDRVLPVKPFLAVATRDVLQRSCERRSVHEHLEAGLKWLLRAQDATPDGGVSYGYSLRGGWRPSYIETTGYIAVTFFKLADRFPELDLKRRAIRMADWLCEVQNPDGSFANPRFHGGRGLVFDTGQDIFGLVWAYNQSNEERYLAAAERAGNWLVAVADKEGRWTRRDFLEVPHVYNTRTAWALLLLDRQSPKLERVQTARANLDWALSQQTQAGLFNNCSFQPGVDPYTHTIDYAIRGLWESGVLLNDDRYRDAALRAADTMAKLVTDSGFVAGQVQTDGQPAAKYCCLTGNCQLAISFAKMARATGNAEFRRVAVPCAQYVMAHQDLTTKYSGIQGAIAGSSPIWGRYSPFTYPNWAAKFFVDALDECSAWL